jgi:hypothetical protein
VWDLTKVPDYSSQLQQQEEMCVGACDKGVSEFKHGPSLEVYLEIALRKFFVTTIIHQQMLCH